jgi:hypothetical protein
LLHSEPELLAVLSFCVAGLFSHQAKPAKAGMPIPCDDHMVVDGNTKEPAHLDNLLGHVDIGAGWRRVARRMIVDEDAAGGV